ncbi:8862_t:CDS:2 [Acaulospora morrowiae]|uniref:8862_t:CDS:1 n=1 Tax=Acaulospora morrowiae TaxID=94023 RepID=A0A9N9IFE5_9GLOM|nr:8862_t:CDS:2 [Acaulospora morrowiae]
MSQVEECPLCSSKIAPFHINFTLELSMCINELCPYPFGNEISRYLKDTPTLVNTRTESTSENNISNAYSDNGLSSSTTASETLFDTRSIENSNNLTSPSMLSSEKNGNVTDLSQYDEILNVLSSNIGANLTSDQAINSLLDEIDFSVLPSSTNLPKSDNDNDRAVVSVDEYEKILFGSSEVDTLLGSIDVNTSNDNTLDVSEYECTKENCG